MTLDLFLDLGLALGYQPLDETGVVFLCVDVVCVLCDVGLCAELLLVQVHYAL